MWEMGVFFTEGVWFGGVQVRDENLIQDCYGIFYEELVICGDESRKMTKRRIQEDIPIVIATIYHTDLLFARLIIMIQVYTHYISRYIIYLYSK